MLPMETVWLSESLNAFFKREMVSQPYIGDAERWLAAQPALAAEKERAAREAAEAEKAAMAQVLTACPNQILPHG